MKNNDDLLEKLKLNIALSNFKEENYIVKNTPDKNNIWRYYMKNKIAIASLFLLITISGVAFAFNSEMVKEYFRGLGNGLDTAAQNGYIEEVNMEKIEVETKIENNNLIDNINCGVKVEDFVMDDYNLSMKFSLEFEEEINEIIDITNLHNIELKDLYILDENNTLIYNMLNKEDFEKMCQKHNLNFKWGEFDDRYLNNGLNSFISAKSKELNLIELQYNMYTDKYPKSKELDLYFSKITFTENDKEEKTTLVGDWYIHLDVPEKFYNRTEEYYKVVSCSNSNFNVYTAKVTDTGFEFGMTIDKEIKPEYPNVFREKSIEIINQYANNEDEMVVFDNQNELSQKLNELKNTSPYKEMLEEYNDKNNPIRSKGWNLPYSYGGDEDCYVMNDSKEKFYSTLSPSRKVHYEFTDNNKYDFYETYSMTKYNASDEITMIVNYRGNIEKIVLRKI